MKALITGASGFLGSHLADVLKDKGYEVFCLVRKTSNLRWLDGKGYTYIYGDITDEMSLHTAVKDVDIVFHCAALVSAVDSTELYRVNAGGTRNLLIACQYHSKNLKKFVLVSSVATMGPSKDGQPLDENSPLMPVSHYGRSKVEAENLTLKCKDLFPITIVRPPPIYGPRDTATLQIFQLLSKGLAPMVSPKAKMLNLCYVKDVVKGIILAGEKEEAKDQVFIIADKRNLKWDDIVKTAQIILKRRIIKLPVPPFAFYAYAFLNEKWAKLRGKNTIVTIDRAKEMLEKYWIYDIKKAQKILGYQPEYEFYRGAKETFEWYKSQGWI